MQHRTGVDHKAPPKECAHEPAQLEELLRIQINRLADPRANRELHGWWNWDPVGAGGGATGGLHATSATARIRTAAFSASLPDLEMELVVADPHDRVIDSCRECFSVLGLPVTLTQAPMQEALLKHLDMAKALGAPKDCFVVFGAYGSGEVESALQKQLAEAFPEQMENLRAQATGATTGSALCGGGGNLPHKKVFELNMANQGRVWIAEEQSSSRGDDEVGDPGRITLVACAAYPRCQRPSEEAAIGQMFCAALEAIAELAFSRQATELRTYKAVDSREASGSESYATGGEKSQRMRVVTHALGSFVGHTEPEIFGRGLSRGFCNFITDHGGLANATTTPKDT